MKKFLGVIMAAAMVLSLAACGGTSSPSPSADAEKKDYKIGIITGTVSQGEEEFRAAEAMAKKYPEMIVTKTYPDNFAEEQDQTIARVVELAEDPDIKAIVFVQAVPGAKAAIEKVRETRPDMFFFCGVPGEDPGVIAPVADVIMNNDELSMGVKIIEQAEKMGAKTFVHISFPRHMSYENLARRRDLLKKTCEEKNIKFIEANAPDPSKEGTPAAQKAVKELVPQYVAEYGKDTAFFSTNCGMQEALITSVLEQGAIYPVQCCPSPMHAYPGALGISVPEDKMTDMAYMTKAIANAIKEKNGDPARFSTWPVAINMTIVEAGVEYSMLYLDGKTNGKNDTKTLTEVVSKVTDGASFTMTPYEQADGTKIENYYMVLCEFVDFTKLAD